MTRKPVLDPVQPLPLHPLIPLSPLVKDYIDYLVMLTDIFCRDGHKRVNDVTE